MNKQTRGLPRAQSRGFTLIELMVVVFIIALLASIVIVNISSVRQKGRDAKRLSDISTVASALQSYYADNHTYPNATGTTAQKYISIVDTELKQIPPLPTYLAARPVDPLDTVASPCGAVAPFGYRYSLPGGDYYLIAIAENQSAAGTAWWTPTGGSACKAYIIKSGEQITDSFTSAP